MSAPRTAWTPLSALVHVDAFDAGALGPYRLGRRVRTTALGQVRLALHEAFDEVLEVETFDALARSALVGPEGTLMTELAEVTRLSHPNVARIVGAGMEGSIPYVVRVHHLGRTLDELLAASSSIGTPLAACVLFAAASATGYLATAGSAPGVCSLGGFDARDLLLGADGEILATGAGLGRVRTPLGDPALADRASLATLAERLDVASGGTFEAELRHADGFEEVARLVRHRYRGALADRASHVARALGGCFAGALAEERAFFGMPPSP